MHLMIITIYNISDNIFECFNFVRSLLMIAWLGQPLAGAILHVGSHAVLLTCFRLASRCEAVIQGSSSSPNTSSAGSYRLCSGARGLFLRRLDEQCSAGRDRPSSHGDLGLAADDSAREQLATWM